MKNENFLGLLGLAIVLKFIQAMVICILWGWFVVPLFHFPSLNIPYAIGLSALFVIFSDISSLKAEESFPKLFQRAFLAPVLALFVGWIAHFFI